MRHYANQCKVQQKINNLEIDENLKKTLLNILINSELEETTSSSDEQKETDNGEI